VPSGAQTWRWSFGADEVAVEAWLTSNGDDPVPALSFAFYDTRHGLVEASTALRGFLAEHQR
jgi:hypothetical protein